MTRLVIIVVKIGLPSKDPTAEGLLLDFRRALSGTIVTGPNLNIQSPYSNSGSKEHQNIKSIQRTRSRDVPSGHMLVLGCRASSCSVALWRPSTKGTVSPMKGCCCHATCGCVDVILDGGCGAVQSPARRWADHRCTCASVLEGKSDSCRVHRRACSSWCVDAQVDTRILPGALR